MAMNMPNTMPRKAISLIGSILSSATGAVIVMLAAVAMAASSWERGHPVRS
jgi:hypothetical protein